MHSKSMAHPTSDELENCLLNRISEDGRRIVEEHVFICHSCRASLDNIEITILARNQALKDIEREERAKTRKWVRFAIPARAYAGCAAALIAVLGLTYVAKTGGQVPESQISLTATRSGVARRDGRDRGGKP